MTTNRLQSHSELTPRQRQVLQFITSHLDNNGYPPTLREIAAHLQISGPLPVYELTYDTLEQTWELAGLEGN